MRAGRAPLRILFSAFALAGLVWAGWSLARTLPTRGLLSSAARIAGGDTYRPEVMRALATRALDIDLDDCDESVLLAASTIHARMAEDAVALGELNVIDERLAALERTAAQLVRCSPDQGIGWLMLLWSRNLQRGFTAELVPLLEASYRAAPREAWVAVRRNPVAFSLYRSLSEPLQDRVMTELVDIANARLVDRAVDIMTGPAARYLDRIGPRLEPVPLAVRSQISRRIYQAGYDIDIAGVQRDETRPWRR